MPWSGLGGIRSETEAAITGETMGGTVPFVSSGPGLATDALKVTTNEQKEAKDRFMDVVCLYL